MFLQNVFPKRRRDSGAVPFSHREAAAPRALFAAPPAAHAPLGAAAPHTYEHQDEEDVERGRGLGEYDFANEPELRRVVIRSRRRRRNAVAAAEADAEEALADIEAEGGAFGDGEGLLGPGSSAAEAAELAALPPSPAQAAPADGDAEADAGAGAELETAGPARLRRRVDVDDGITLVGDVTQEALRLAEQRFLPLCLHDWSTRHLVPQAAVTGLLRMFHGRFGKVLGVKPIHLVRRGNIPQTAATAYKYSAEVTDALGLDMLHPGKVALPAGDFNLVGRGTQRTVTYWSARRLIVNVAYKLMNPALNSEATPMLYDIDPALPPGIYCGPTYYSSAELRDRRAAYDRAVAALPAVLARVLPGITADKVRIICIGLNLFFDGVNPPGNQANAIFAFLLGITNLHPAVAHSPHGVVVGGFWNPPRVLRKSKVAPGDVAMTASPMTLTNEAAVTAMLFKEAVAKPLQDLLQGEPLVMHTRLFKGLAYVPEPVRRRGVAGQGRIGRRLCTAAFLRSAPSPFSVAVCCDSRIPRTRDGRPPCGGRVVWQDGAPLPRRRGARGRASRGERARDDRTASESI